MMLKFCKANLIYECNSGCFKSKFTNLKEYIYIYIYYTFLIGVNKNKIYKNVAKHTKFYLV
jgi:hypothetical protein